jgi:hypothetical protein
MAFKYQVYKTQRVCMIRFRRQADGEPAFGFPDVDNRGSFRKYTDGNFDRGPVVPVMQSDDIYIKVLRERIDTTAPLFATSSDEKIMTVNNKNQLPDNYSMTLTLTGIGGGSGTLPKKASLRIHYGSPTGVVIGELGVWVFSKMNVNLTPHRVNISNAAGTSAAAQVDIGAVIGLTRAFWRPYGIDLNVAPVVNTPYVAATAGQVVWAEHDALLGTLNTPSSINAYFVSQTDPNWLGWGFSRAFINDPTNGRTNPGIILADRDGGFDRHLDTHYLANDLAHEIGHFFGLQHIDNRTPDGTAANANNFRDDSWARRCLMHNFNASSFTATPPPGSPPDVGYGTNSALGNRGNRGGLITLKDLTDVNNSTTNHITDPEYVTARNTINSAAGPY